MKQELVDNFRELKHLTEECIESLQDDNFDALKDLLLKRQKTLDLVKDINASKEDNKNLTEEFDILSTEKILFDLIQGKKIELRDKINSIKKNKTATSRYNSRTSKNAVFFSKKI